jgi:hypothetical protein
MNRTDFSAIESHIRRAHIQRSAYLGELLGNALADAWLAGSAFAADLKAGLQGAVAGMEEHRRRRTVAAAHAAH